MSPQAELRLGVVLLFAGVRDGAWQVVAQVRSPNQVGSPTSLFKKAFAYKIILQIVLRYASTVKGGMGS